jgi:hypothetical protein
MEKEWHLRQETLFLHFRKRHSRTEHALHLNWVGCHAQHLTYPELTVSPESKITPTEDN